jgi:putative DNA primase/helicase
MSQRRRQDETRGRELLEAALDYAEAGLPVFPLHSINKRSVCTCGRSNCKSPGKHPRIKEGFRKATTDEAQIRKWWTRWGEKANIGGALGGQFVAVDVDVADSKGGQDSLRALQDEYGQFPATATAKTGKYGRRRGKHYFFLASGEIGSGAAVLGHHGIDVRGVGGYVVLPPSRHRSGVDYEWVTPLSKVAAMPEALEEALKAKYLPASDERESTWEPTGVIPKKETLALLREGGWEDGVQRDTAMKCARALLGLGEDRDTVVAKVLDALERSEQFREEAWTQRDVEELVDSEIDKPPPPLEKKPRLLIEQSLTDTGNAVRFAEQYKDEVRFVPEWNCWVFWMGDRWERDAEVFVTQRMQEVARRIPREVSDLGEEDDDMRAKVLRWATVSLQASKVRAAVEMARAQAPLISHPDEFDADPFLLNCRNGTLDLRTGELRPHRREDMLTQQVACDYDPDATSEDWDRVLRDAFDGAEELIVYLQRVFGYCLTGDTSEEKFFFFYGKSGAGKGTILESFAGMLGDYTRTMSARSLTKSAPQSGGSASEDIARLAGGRFALANEFDPGDRFAAAQVNTLTGRDKVAARFLHKDTFEFFPQVKIFVAANDLPKQSSSPESGVWRRIQVVPFDHKVAKVDRGLKARLERDEARGAILAWALHGCLEWQRDGLGHAPSQVKEAVDDYKEQSDPHRVFIEDKIEESDQSFVPNKVMWTTYQGWANDQGIRKPLSQKALTQVLRERGFEQAGKTVKRDGKRTSVKVWQRIRIRGVSDQQQRRYEEAC